MSLEGSAASSVPVERGCRGGSGVPSLFPPENRGTSDRNDQLRPSSDDTSRPPVRPSSPTAAYASPVTRGEKRIEATFNWSSPSTPVLDGAQVAPKSVDRRIPETSPPASTTPDPDGSKETTFTNPPPSIPL